MILTRSTRRGRDTGTGGEPPHGSTHDSPEGAPGVRGLLRVAGGRRYALALVVDALGAGLLRPFLLLYGMSVLGLDPAGAGLALSLGLLAGLVAIPLTGRWIDRGGRSLPAAATLAVRAAGVAVLLGLAGPVGFTLAAVLLGLGTQSWPTAHAAVVTALTSGRTRDAALAAGRSLRNAGLGAGALVATVAVARGTTALRALAVVTALACLVSAALVWSLRLTAPVGGGPGRAPGTGGPGRAGTPPAAAGTAAAGTAEAGPAGKPGTRPAAVPGMTALAVANLPFAFCFDVLEVALPALLVAHLHAAPSWPSAVFVGNTVLVIAVQVAVVVALGRFRRRSVLAAAGVVLAVSYLGFWGGAALGGTPGTVVVAAVAVVFTLGEILYAGSSTALVVAAAPPEQLGRALSRWELSTGLGRAAAPAALTGLLAVGPGVLWGVLALATLLAAAAVRRFAPRL